MTKEYKKLKSRIKEIQSNFESVIEAYPKEINSKNQDLISSFILLCHTELENYFENVCERIISHSKAVYDKSIVSNKEIRVLPSLLSLSLMSDKQFSELDQTHRTTQDRLEKLYTNYFATIKTNNGIKEKDLKKMLPLIGIDMDIIDEMLLSLLDAYGTKRGQIAHTTRKKIRRFQEEKTAINTIITAIVELDNIIEKTK